MSETQTIRFQLRTEINILFAPLNYFSPKTPSEKYNKAPCKCLDIFLSQRGLGKYELA